MKEFWRGVIVLVYLTVVGGLGVLGLVKLAGAQSRELVGVVMGGYERFTTMHVESVLKRVAQDVQGKKLETKVCEGYRDEITNSGGFLNVLSIGNSEGKIVCTMHENVLGVLPDVRDRLYYQKVQQSEDMVVGEYAVARTTGQKVLHFAYPLKGEAGEFEGFVLAGVSLDWFVNEKVDEYLKHQGIVIIGVDEKGKLLFSYPAGFAEAGTGVVTAEMMGEMLGGKTEFRVHKGYDGVYRVFAYKTIYQEDKRAMLFLVGVSVVAFRHIALPLTGLIIVLAALGWWGLGFILRYGKQVVAKGK